MRRLSALLFTALFLHALCAAEAQPIANEHLENLHRLTPKVFAGAEPEGDAAFKALSELGIKTVITVDGAKPNIDLAHKYGLRYVHLPIGYDGVPTERTKDIAKALIELDGPIYVHCHHGKHRGPAAAASACVAGGLLTNEEALDVLKKMGTAANYQGLWASTRDAKPVPLDELKQRKVDYREISPIAPFADAMVSVDQHYDGLKLAQKAGWTKPKDHPDVDPAHEALQLRELFFEAMRTDEFKARPADFQTWAKSAFTQSEALNKLLQDGPNTDATRTQADALMTNLKNTCATCHKAYRDKK